MQIDLTRYVVAKWGKWFCEKDAYLPGELRLGSAEDGVTLAGPVRVKVSVQARNHFTFAGAGSVALQTRDVFAYTLDIPPGQMWTYPAPSLVVPAPGPPGHEAPRNGIAPAPGDEARAAAAAAAARDALLGTNAGFGLSIRPAGPEACADPCAPDPCVPRQKTCGCGGGRRCGCDCESDGDDLPCDFATGRGGHAGHFFPAACEPCAPGAPIAVPPVKGPSLLVPAARGGTVRTRYFNGMFISKEDLWTDQNNNRIKHALMNRAMGQGVVWGLDLSLDGEALCVLPGYAVDCCGNDIVISTPYRVDSAALVRDPAAAATLAAARVSRMHLLLEYFECPEEPRPVHGDPCAPDSVSCEMSRIRETARLRLTPPCDVDDSGPIKTFLETVRKLRGDPVVGPLMAASAAIAARVPFSVFVEGLDGRGVVGSVTLQPRLMTEGTVSGDAVGQPRRSLMKRARITLRGADGFQFAGGAVVKEPPSTGQPQITRTAATVVWEDDLPSPGNTTPVPYAFNTWRLQHADGVLSADVTRVILSVLPAEGLRMRLHVEIPPTAVDAVAPPPPPPLPCLTDACDPAGRPRFGIPIPWLHAGLSQPGTAADPKVLTLAILYALTVSRIVQTGPGVPDAVRTEQQALAAALNHAAWRLLYGEDAGERRADLVQAIRKLFQAWCQALLYPGPRCECGCDPHGVVVGCALVVGGTIRSVDPWGGRRWVVHYPLLSYWGKQFGLQPLDALASKFFDLICCVAHLYPSRDGVILTGVPPIDRAAAPGRSAVVPLGGAVLIFDEPANVRKRLQELGISVTGMQALTPAAFIGRVVAGLPTLGTGVPGGSLVHYTVEGVPELHLIAPADGSAGDGGAPR